MPNKKTDISNCELSWKTLDSLSSKRRSLQTELQWKPGESVSRYHKKSKASSFISNNHEKHDQNDLKPLHTRFLDLSKELDKNLQQKHHKKLLEFNETQLCPWKKNENSSNSSNSSQKRTWTVNQKLEPLSYQPKADLQERFVNNKLSVSGSKWNLGKRDGDRVLLKEFGVESSDNGSVSRSLNNSNWAEAFTKTRVKRLNEVFLTLSDTNNTKFRSRRLKCSCLFHQ